MNDLDACPICDSGLVSTQNHPSGRYHHVNCPRCREFLIEARFIEDSVITTVLGEARDRRRVNASSWLSHAPGITNLRTQKALEDLESVRAPGVLDRAEILLLKIEKMTERVGEEININAAEFLTATWSLDRRELSGLTELLSESGLVAIGRQAVGANGYMPVKIAAGGWRRLEELRRGDAASHQGFVAMWFCDEMKRIYDTSIEPAIRAAGFRAHRVDLREYEGKVDDEIVAQIRRSRFVVADYTGHRGGVYYEAGFAHGLGLPVFFTCRQDELKNLHFDVRQYNTIVWTEAGDLQTALQLRIESVLGKGPLGTDTE